LLVVNDTENGGQGVMTPVSVRDLCVSDACWFALPVSFDERLYDKYAPDTGGRRRPKAPATIADWDRSPPHDER
jgi:hypothetical protein